MLEKVTASKIVYVCNQINMFAGYMIGQYGWDGPLSEYLFVKWKATCIREGKLCTCKSAIQPIPSYIDRMLLQNVFTICSRRRILQEIALGLCAHALAIHYIDRHIA